MGLTLGIALKCYTSVAKRLKLNVRKGGLALRFVEVTGEKLVWVFFLPPPPTPILNRVKIAVLKFADLVNKNVCDGLQF